MELTPFERQVLWNQLEILKHLDTGNSDDLSSYQEILEKGYRSEYDRVMHVTRYGAEMPLEDARLVHEIFDMMDGLYRYHSENGGLHRFSFDTFRGFDGNNEGDLCSYSRFLVERLGRWKYLGINEFNSHMPTKEIYRRMLKVWQQFPYPGRVTALTDDQVRAIEAAVRS